jgi:hypothetical protein
MGRLAGFKPIADQFFSREAVESLAQSRFPQSGLCKIWFSKNLDTKILITDDLATRFSRLSTVTASTILAHF